MASDALITEEKLLDYHNNCVYPYLNGATHTGFTPVGSIISVLGTSAPTYYLKCDGGTYNIQDYPQLANFIENEYGDVDHFGGDGTTTFGVPDYSSVAMTGTVLCICSRNNYIDASIGGYPVEVNNPTDGQILVFDSSSQAWVNRTV